MSAFSKARAGDRVRIDHKGRLYFALVEHKVPGKMLHVTPVDRNVTWLTAKPREVVEVWRRVA